jgi:hypothetical protein
MSEIVQKDQKAGKVLREIAKPIDFTKDKKTLPKMLDEMREAMFSQDHQEGVLEQWLMSNYSLTYI